MKTKINLIQVCLLGVVLFVMSAFLPASAQPVFTNLYSFSANPGGNSDGANPTAGLILSGNTLYGTATQGGTYGSGTVFAINTDGTDFTNLHSFAGYPNDGGSPRASLILSGNTLYGTAGDGGTYGDGTVFALNTDGTGFTNLYNFTDQSDGADLIAGLILVSNTLYGTASNGGTNNGTGTVFKVNTDGSCFTVLHTFTNSPDGAHPQCALTLAGNTLYGTTSEGGALGPEGFNSEGTVFAINTDGSGYRILHNFTDLFGSGTNDGLAPEAGLVLSGDTLYGTTSGGGAYDAGTVFAMNTNGENYVILNSFMPSNEANEGSIPTADLFLSGNTLYGTASNGGSQGLGTVFAINTDGTGFTNLFNLGSGSSGENPLAGLVLSGNTLYGTLPAGGDGTIFALSLVPSLGIVSVGNQVVLSWPTWAPNFGLQTTTNLSAGSWSNITDGIMTVGDDYVFTNIVNEPAAFFHLHSQ